MSPVIDGKRIDPNQVGEGDLTSEQKLYKQNILDHFKNPRNKRLLEDPTHEHADKNPFCGDVIKVTLTVENDAIIDVGFTGSGCAISQAAMSMVTKEIKGMVVEDVLNMDTDDILSLLGIPIGPVRMKCAMLGLRVTQKALEES